LLCIINTLQEKIWNYESLDNAYGRLKDIATQLLEQTVWKVQDFTKNVIEELQVYYNIIIINDKIGMF
jgi:hypothetical protein